MKGKDVGEARGSLRTDRVPRADLREDLATQRGGEPGLVTGGEEGPALDPVGAEGEGHGHALGVPWAPASQKGRPRRAMAARSAWSRAE